MAFRIIWAAVCFGKLFLEMCRKATWIGNAVGEEEAEELTVHWLLKERQWWKGSCSLLV